MIPVIESTAAQAAQTATYRLDFSSGRVRGRCDGYDALCQAVYKILLTERCASPIYGPDYGVELERFFGRGADFARSSLESALREAVCCDDRVSGIADFSLEEGAADGAAAAFTVLSREGEMAASLEVKV